MKYCGYLLLLLLLLGAENNILHGQTHNVVFVLVDDQGWTGTSVQMDSSRPNSLSDYHQTPNLDQLAQEGITFAQAYSPAPKCSPSRNSILTGQTPARSQFTTTSTSVDSTRFLLEPSSAVAIDDALITFPEWVKLQNPNIMTAHFGKWHLYNQGPEGHGFDRGDGNTGNNEGDQGGLLQTDPKRIFQITDSAITFMTDAVNAGRPFYVQLSHYAVHEPIEAQQTSMDTYSDTLLRPFGTAHNNADYGAMTEDVDEGLGMLLSAISALGLDSNTYVVYMSDNGGASSSTSNSPLLRGKLYINEGGIRVPMVIRGPGIPNGSRSEVPAVGYDLYLTFVDWLLGSGSAVPANVEGENLNLLLQNGGTGTRDNPIIFHSPHYDQPQIKVPRSAIVADSFKLIVNYELGTFSLYNLAQDIRENDDLKDSLPELTETLCLQLRDYLKNAGAEMPVLNELDSANLGTAPDADNDGLDDLWEFTELLTHIYGAQDNPDGDSLTNIEEFIAGTDPYVFDTIATNVLTTNSSKVFRIFPNPATEMLRVEGLQAKDKAILFDALGRRAARIAPKNGTVNLSHLPGGIYFVSITRKGKLVYNEKLVILN